MNDSREMLLQLKGGSYKAFTQVYEVYFDLLYGFVLRLTHSHAQTREIVQETFIRVWINRQGINPELSFKAWLFKVAQHLVTDHLRQQFASPVFEDYLNHRTNEKLITPSSLDSFDFDLFNRSLSEAKKKLSPRQLYVFEMCKEKGFSPSEVALELQVAEQTVYNYLHQALTLLRKEIPSVYFLAFAVFFL